MDANGAKRPAAPWFWPYDVDELLRAAATLEGLRKAVGTVNPRPPGWRNDLIQLVKKLIARSLAWYTRPLLAFNASVSRSLEEMAAALDHLAMNMVALERVSSHRVALEERLAQNSEAHVEIVDRVPGNERTAYIIGLFGSGRHYINELMLQNIGRRAKYFRDTIRLHPGPTPMIYSGHATLKYVSRGQAQPQTMRRILEAAGSGFADVIFVYRHPLDSLLTNWIWWRSCIRENVNIPGISQMYKSTDDLCADLEDSFSEFQAFAQGDPGFFAGAPGPRFLSFPEFVEETEFHLQCATLTLRLEDCMIDPRKEFSKIVEVMSVPLDLSGLYVSAPKAKPYGYWAVKSQVPRFKSFIEGLDAGTKRRIEKIGYDVEV
ncbi:MAG: hypothetical protein ABSG65_21375 [Bryobacteraceae bacterium]